MSGLSLFSLAQGVKALQVLPQQTTAYATVIYSEPINVRGGPSTVHYPIVGNLFPGDIVPALGVSPGREWVEISFPAGPDGIGWVYAIYVSISGGELPIVEAPFTPTPPMTSTIDPTLAAAFNIQPTASRVPTFTPPPPLTIPQYQDTSQDLPRGVPMGFFVASLLVLGGSGFLVSVILRK